MRIAIILVAILLVLTSSCTVNKDLEDIDESIKKIEIAEQAKANEPLTIKARKLLTQCSEPWEGNDDKSISDYFSKKGIYIYSITRLKLNQQLTCTACDCASDTILEVEVDTYNSEKIKDQHFKLVSEQTYPAYCEKDSDCVINGDSCSAINIENYEQDSRWCNNDKFCSARCLSNECTLYPC